MVTWSDYEKDRKATARLKGEIDRIAEDIRAGRIKDADDLAARIGLAREFCVESFPEKLWLFDRIYPARFARLFKDPLSAPGKTEP